MLSYPENLPLPLQANYSESVSPNVKRSSMSDGYIRQRKVTSNAPRSLSVTWYFNSEQLVQFEDFLIQLNEGADWFLLKVPTKTYSEGVVSFATTERTVRFQSGKYTKTLQFFSDDKWLWKIAANLDLSMDDYAVDDIMPPEETQWNTNSDYDFEFLFSGGVPTVKGRKKCFIVSAENPTGTEDSNIIINSDSNRTGLNFYTEAFQLNTTNKKILEIQTDYVGVDANTYSSYYFMGRMRNSDSGLGLGLISARNNRTEFIQANYDFAVINKYGYYVSKSVKRQQSFAVDVAPGTPIVRRDIFINDPAENELTYYGIINDKLACVVTYNQTYDFSAVLYHIGDPTQNGLYNFIKLTAVRSKNSLFKPIPEGV